MDFKVGDKVRIKKDADTSSWNKQGLMDKWRGKVMTISTICGDSIFVEECKNENFGLGWMWSKEDFEKVEERKDDMKKEFTKADLKPGNMCKTRNGEIYMWLNDKLYCQSKIEGLNHTEDDLTNFVNRNWDVVQVRDSEHSETDISKLFEKFNELPIIWDRKEEPVTKDVSLEEINALLKEKFPDVDKFNLPIKE